MVRTATLLPSLGLCALLSLAAGPADWTQWRGSDRDGHATGLTGVDARTETRSLWRIEVGEGQASPVVADGRVVLFDRNGDEERVSAFDLETGAQIWSASETVRFKAGMGGGHYGAGPKSTPAIADGLVVTYGVTSVLAVRRLDDGSTVWRRDLHEEHPDPTLHWGNSMSPIIVEGRVVIQYGNDRNGGIRAFDLDSGEPLWAVEGYGSSYSSPVLFEPSGEPAHLILMTYEGPLGVSLGGEVLWSVEAPMSFTRQNTATPALSGDLLVFGSEGRPLSAYRLEKSADRWTAEPVWSRDDLSIDMASPVAFDERVCVVITQKRGQLVCVESASGEEIYRSAPRFDDFAVLLVSGENLLVLRPQGELLSLERDARSFEPDAELQVSSSEVWAHPAVLADGMVVKSFDRLERLVFESSPARSDLR